MKKIINKVKKFFKITFTLAAIVFLGITFYKAYSTPTIEVVETETTSEYEERVADKMSDTHDLWLQKHRVWAEQEVSREIIEQQEARLLELNQVEVSL